MTYDEAMKRVQGLLPAFMRRAFDNRHSVTALVFSTVWAAFVEPMQEEIDELRSRIEELEQHRP